MIARLFLTWDGQRYSNSPAAQHFLVSTARSYVGDYYLRQISAVLYDRMHLIRALLRGEPTVTPAYATTLDSPQVTEEFIRGQHGGSLAPAYQLARTQDLSSYTRFLDLGGGSGAFAIEAVKRYPGLSAIVFDLPQVVVVTEKVIQESGLEKRITCAGGDLRTDPWPGGAECRAPARYKSRMVEPFDRPWAVLRHLALLCDLLEYSGWLLWQHRPILAESADRATLWDAIPSHHHSRHGAGAAQAY